MTAQEFKTAWGISKLNRWYDFDPQELDRLPIAPTTKAWLKHGFPDGAAPFLGFGALSYGHKIHSIAEAYAYANLAPAAQNHWIIGSDGGGNPIVIDTAHQDSILLLDHEQNFEIITPMNTSVKELAHCLLAYKNFVHSVQQKYGQQAYLEDQFTLQEVELLQAELTTINPNWQQEASFWANEVTALIEIAEQSISKH